MDKNIRSEFLVLNAKLFANDIGSYRFNQINYYERRCYSEYGDVGKALIDFIVKMSAYGYTDLEIYEAIYLVKEEKND